MGRATVNEEGPELISEHKISLQRAQSMEGKGARPGAARE